MGILDDAIREHLELKRQHGVPEEELRRQEEEALGPARRNVAPAQTDEGDGELALEDEVDVEPAAEHDLSETEEPVADHELLETGEPADREMAPFGVQEETALHDAETALHEGGAAARDDESALPGDEAAPPEDETARDEGEPALDREEPDLHREEPGLDQDAAPVRTSETPPSGFESLDDDDLLDEEGEPEGDQGDVLEETPDFLQETPEHDRLWFEQKPPRDFDFD